MPAVSFLNLLQNLATFVKTSYKRMALWIEVAGKHLGQEKMKRLKLIGETKWSGESNVATTIFGRFDNASVSTLVNLVTCLSRIHDSDKFDAKTKQKANVLLQSLLKFETILTAFTYLYIFDTTITFTMKIQCFGRRRNVLAKGNASRGAIRIHPVPYLVQHLHK
jgi:hypothetical protein